MKRIKEMKIEKKNKESLRKKSEVGIVKSRFIEMWGDEWDSQRGSDGERMNEVLHTTL